VNRASPHPDRTRLVEEGCSYRRVLCARAASESGSSLRRLGWGGAKGRSPVAWELRPHDRSRCAEHGGNCDSACLARVCCAPAVVMISPPTILRNASRAQSEGRAGKVKQDREQRGQGHYKGRSPKAPAPLVPRSGPRGSPDQTMDYRI
jgi:hypothetical protein